MQIIVGEQMFWYMHMSFGDIVESRKAWIEWSDRNRTSRSSMLPTGSSDKLEFVLHPYRGAPIPCGYPFLKSAWYTLQPYDPPELEFARWEITPPAYLNIETLIHDGFGYIEAPENSSIRLDVRVKDFPKVSARLLSNGQNFIGKSWPGYFFVGWENG